MNIEFNMCLNALGPVPKHMKNQCLYLVLDDAPVKYIWCQVRAEVLC